MVPYNVLSLPASYTNKRWAYARAEYLNADGRRRVLVWQLEMRSQGRRGAMALRENCRAVDLPGTRRSMSREELLSVVAEIESSGRTEFAGDAIFFSEPLRADFLQRCRARLDDAESARADSPALGPSARRRHAGETAAYGNVD